jgi:hypothetical protein
MLRSCIERPHISKLPLRARPDQRLGFLGLAHLDRLEFAGAAQAVEIAAGKRQHLPINNRSLLEFSFGQNFSGASELVL